MNDIEKIFEKRAQIEELRSKAAQIRFTNEAEHTTIFNRIWRLNNEIKAIETAVNHGVSYSTTKNKPIQSIQSIQYDMGDDFTNIPVEPCSVKSEPTTNSNININGIISMLEILQAMPKTSDNLKDIEKLENILTSLCK